MHMVMSLCQLSVICMETVIYTKDEEKNCANESNYYMNHQNLIQKVDVVLVRLPRFYLFGRKS